MSEQFCVIDPITIAGAVLTSTNVPENDYAPHSMGTTYALNDLVIVVADHLIYKSLQAANTGHLPSGSIGVWWSVVSSTNARAMFDGKVSTQTSNANSIVVELTPSQIAGGVCLMNVEADTVVFTSTDPTDGVVYGPSTMYAEKANSGSSFWNWCFKRIRRRTVFTVVDLPPYYTGVIKIEINKPGGTAKCGMCMVGPVEQLGFTKFGLTPGIKDYSTNLFDAFGNLTSVERPWAKKLSVPVEVDNSIFDDLYGLMVGWRAKPVVWVASTLYESTTLLAKFSDFKIVLENPIKSPCDLTLDGMT